MDRCSHDKGLYKILGKGEKKILRTRTLKVKLD